MKIPTYSPRNPGDHPKLPQEMFRAFEPTDSQLKDITSALQNDLTFAENISSEIRTVPLRHGVESDIHLQRIKSPTMALVVSSEVYDYATLKWKAIDQGVVRVCVKWDTDPGEESDVTILFVRG